MKSIPGKGGRKCKCPETGVLGIFEMNRVVTLEVGKLLTMTFKEYLAVRQYTVSIIYSKYIVKECTALTE